MKQIRISLQSLVVLFAVLSLLLRQLDGFAGDPGVGWHLKTGEWILTHATVPAHDPFLASAEPRPWVSDQWLSDVILQVLFELGSWPLLYAVLTVLYLITYCGVLYFGMCRGTQCMAGSFLALSFATLLAFKIGQLHFILRPVIFSFLLFAILVVRIWSLRQAFSESKQLPGILWRSFIEVPIIFTFWANLHAGFVMGLMLLVLLLVSIPADRVFRAEKFPPGAGIACMLLCAVSFGATLINPWGPGLLRSILFLGDSPYFMNLHQEWLALDVHEPEGRIFVAIVSVFVFGAFIARSAPKEWNFLTLLSLMVFGYLALDAVRMAPFFGIVAVRPLAQMISHIGQAPIFTERVVLARFQRGLMSLESREATLGRGAVILCLVATLLPLWAFFSQSLPLYGGVFGQSPSRFPLAALEELKKIRLQRIGQGSLTDMIVVAPSAWGGAITFAGYGKPGSREPRIRALFDDRNTLLGEEFHRQATRSIERGVGTVEFARAHGAEFLLLRPENPVVHALKFERLRESELEILFEDTVSVLLRLRERQGIGPPGPTPAL